MAMHSFGAASVRYDEALPLYASSPFDQPSVSAPGDTTAAGTNTTAARTAHVHAREGTAITATVATSETTTSTSFTTLTTTTDSVTVTASASGVVLVLISCRMSNSLGGDEVDAAVSVDGAAVSGGNPLIANQNPTGTDALCCGGWQLVTGLSAASHTFAMRYRVQTGGTGTFSQRRITAIPL